MTITMSIPPIYYLNKRGPLNSLSYFEINHIGPLPVPSLENPAKSVVQEKSMFSFSLQLDFLEKGVTFNCDHYCLVSSEATRKDGIESITPSGQRMTACVEALMRD